MKIDLSVEELLGLVQKHAQDKGITQINPNAQEFAQQALEQLAAKKQGLERA